MCQAVALGADLEWRFVCLHNYNWIGALSVEIAHFVRMVSLDMYFCSRYANEEGRAAIHQSILSGSVMACEFLILNSVRIDAVDAQGNSALHMAAKQGNTGQVIARYSLLFISSIPLQVCLLLKHHADHHLKNHEGQEPLDIAVANSDADIVTLLRYI